jgi:carboxyl-terminal processing protease
MRKINFLLRSTLIVWMLAGGAGAVVAQSQIRIAPPAAEADPIQINSLLERGQKLEDEHRWGEALGLYEDALREHPNDEINQALSPRHDLAKIHYDLARRYGDTSFLRAVATLPQKDALALYGEVLLKIQSHYVAQPNWQALVVRGTADLQVALAEPAFGKQNFRNQTPARLDAFRRQLDQLIHARTIHNRAEAVDTVAQAAQLAHHELDMAPTAAVMEYACGAMGALDEYSSYLTADQLNDVYSQIEGNFVGLGIELKAHDGALLIVKVISGSPADRGGIRAGDRITFVNNQATAKLSTDQAANLLQGEEGSPVAITAVGTKGSERRLTLRREHVDVPSVDDVQIIDREYGVGYMKLACFQKTTSRDVDAALWKLHREGMKSLMIDLRGNPGGLLTSSVEVADKFIEEGKIVETRGRSSLEDYVYTAHKAGTWRVPLVVLIDGDSASASEIFAGAIRDHRRGTIVGQRSYGKGSVQGIFPLTAAGAGVRLTTAKFYSPSGRPISHVGVQPDILVQRAAKPAEGQEPLASAAGQDPVIAAGLQAARRQVAQR